MASPPPCENCRHLAEMAVGTHRLSRDRARAWADHLLDEHEDGLFTPCGTCDDLVVSVTAATDAAREAADVWGIHLRYVHQAGMPEAS